MEIFCFSLWLLAVIAVLVNHWSGAGLRRARVTIEEFCGREGLDVLELRHAGLGARLRVGCSNTQSLYAATVRDKWGRERECWFICGDHLPLVNPNRVEVRWSDPEPAEAKEAPPRGLSNDLLRDSHLDG